MSTRFGLTPVGHVLVHFQKPFCLRVQKRRCSRYPIPNTVQGGNLAARPSCMAGRPDMWASCAQSLAKAPPYSSYKYHGAPSVESVKKVRFRPPKGLPISIFVELRERRGSEGRRTSRLVGSPQSNSNVEALPESIQVRWSFLSSSSVEYRSSVSILQILTESWLSSPSGVSGSRLIRILSNPVWRPKPSTHSMCAQETSLHTYCTENGYRITNVSI
jgi:hypothetical protein